MQLPAGPRRTGTRRLGPERIHALFDELEFRVLRDRLFNTLSSVEPEAEAGFDLDGSILGEGEVGAWLDAHARTGRTGIAVSAPKRGRRRRSGGDRHRGCRRCVGVYPRSR